MQTGEGHAGQAWRGSNTFGDTKLQDSINLQGTFGNVQITGRLLALQNVCIVLTLIL